MFDCLFGDIYLYICIKPGLDDESSKIVSRTILANTRVKR